MDVRKVVLNWPLYRVFALFQYVVDTQLIELSLECRRVLLKGLLEVGPGGSIIFDGLYVVRK